MPAAGRGEHSCVGNPCLSLEFAALLLDFAALLPRKKSREIPWCRGVEELESYKIN